MLHQGGGEDCPFFQYFKKSRTPGPNRVKRLKSDLSCINLLFNPITYGGGGVLKTWIAFDALLDPLGIKIKC